MQNIHMCGIGGIGMSALAAMLLSMGKKVTGSDPNHTPGTDLLEGLGVSITYEIKASNLSPSPHAFVYTAAFDKDNPELDEAKRLGIPTFTYAEMLGLVSREKFTIAVAGTHGKTTTTAMIAQVLIEAGLDPTVIVGSFLLSHKSNFVESKSKSKYFIVEACEYKESFLNFYPDILIVTNIEEDHLDYYKNLENIKKAFSKLISQTKSGPDSAVICSLSDQNTSDMLSDLASSSERKIINYDTVDFSEELTLKGEYNKKDAKAALALALFLGIPKEKALASLNSFKGTWRRFEYKGENSHGALIYDDYAHHPTAVKATIGLAKESYPDKKIVAVFEPHLYSRTKDNLAEYAVALGLADTVILAPIYAAREQYDPSISSEMLKDKILELKPDLDVKCLNNYEEITKAISERKSDELVLVMGAGDIKKVV